MIQVLRTALLCLGLVLVGCFRSPSTHFYSLVSQDRNASAPQLSGEGLDLEVFPIIFPQYLDDPRMVVRSSAHEMVRDEYERWIEALDVNFRRVLLNDLSRHLKSSNVFSSEVYTQRRGAQVVQVEVLQFDVSEAGTAVLKVRWAAAPTREGLSSATLSVSEFAAQANGSSSEAQVAALSGLIDTFSLEVAQRFELGK